MQNSTKLFIGLLSIVSLTAMGCGQGKHPTVSGKVTAAGEPVAGVRVTFAPKAVGDNHTPGPYSTGVTDESGVYTLTTRYGEPGAVIAPHQVSFEWAKMEFDAMMMLRKELANAKGDEAKTAEIKKQIEELSQLKKSLPKVNIHQVDSFTVSAEGTDSANFEIGKNNDSDSG